MDLLNITFDCTEYAKSKADNNFVKYFVAFDVHSVHILRILTDINTNYDEDPGKVLVEHELVDYYPALISYFEENLNIPTYEGDDRMFINEMLDRFEMEDILKAVVDYDSSNGYENWDCEAEYSDVEETVKDKVLHDGLDTLSDIKI